MGRILGMFFFFLGTLLLLKIFYPQFSYYLLPYAYYIKEAFLGVVLVFLGLYILSKNKNWRTAVSIGFIAYLALFLVIPDTDNEFNFEFSFPFRERIEGQTTVVGEFVNISHIEMDRVVGNVKIVSVDGDTIKITANFPLKAEKRGDILEIQCTSECKIYKNKRAVIEIGRELNIERISIKESVGDYLLKIENSLKELNMQNVVGAIEIHEISSDEINISNFVGDLSLDIENSESIALSDGVGDVTITVLEDTKVELQQGSSLLKINTVGDIYEGSKTLKISLSDIIGTITIKKI